jgi:manganese/iron transport system substrate-binding protein
MPVFKLSRLTALLIVVLSLPFFECGSDYVAKANAAGTDSTSAVLKIVTSISPLADMIRNVGGNRVAVSHFVPLNVDPHTYEPTFSSLRAISCAQIIFLNGDGLDRAARENLLAVRGRRCVLVDLSQSVPEPSKNGKDPHYWLDLLLAENYIRAIADNLSALDKDGERYYHQNADQYIERMRALDAAAAAACRKLPAYSKKIVLYHNAWTYAATRYGFTIEGIVESFGTHEPSARQLAQLILKARAQGTAAIIGEPGHGSRILAIVREEAHIPTVITMVEDSLLQPPCDTYLGMMEADLKKLASEISSISTR